MSDKQTSGSIRNKRNDKSPDSAELAHRHAHKDRRRWCHGKEGVPHTPVCMTYKQAKAGSSLNSSEQALAWRVLVCTTCGKELDHYYPMTWKLIPEPPEQKPKPPWVDK